MSADQLSPRLCVCLQVPAQAPKPRAPEEIKPGGPVDLYRDTLSRATSTAAGVLLAASGCMYSYKLLLVTFLQAAS